MKNFLEYARNRLGRFNSEAARYDQPGPKFYTLDENTTFENAPLSSKRELEYDQPVDLPLVSSGKVHVTEKHTIYWISDAKFRYDIESRTTGAPFTDTFFVRVSYFVEQNGEKCDFAIRSRIIWISSPFGVKGAIENTTRTQIK